MGIDKSMDEFVKNFMIFPISNQSKYNQIILKAYPISLKKSIVEKEDDQNSTIKNNVEI